jgi:hypothetical protein
MIVAEAERKLFVLFFHKKKGERIDFDTHSLALKLKDNTYEYYRE